MLVKKLSGITNAAIGDFQYSDCIDLTSSRHDQKKLALKLDLTSSSTCGTLDAIITGSQSNESGNVFTTFINGSGTTYIVSGATYTISNEGCYYLPLTIVMSPGVTEPLTSVPFIKFGFKANGFNVPFNAWLLCG